MTFVDRVDFLLAVLTVIAQGLTVIAVLSFFLRNSLKPIYIFFIRKGMALSFLVAFVATLGSFFYSEIAHYAPCVLCWYQRILMYPQALILGIALARKDSGIAVYSLALSIVGAVIAFYHVLLQRGIVGEILPCSTVGFSVSCAQAPDFHFGYITIPVMALSAFLLIIVLQFIQFKEKPKSKK